MAGFSTDKKNAENNLPPQFRFRRTVHSPIALAAIFFLAGIFSSYIWFNYFYLPAYIRSSFDALHPLLLGQEGLVNPLLAYTVPKDIADLPVLETALRNKIDEELATKTQGGSATSIAVYFRDLNAGRWTGVNEAEQFSPASLLKVPIMIAYFKLAETQPDLLVKVIAYDGSFDDNASEDIKPIKTIEAGKSYTVDELIKFMIGYSDNNATRLLYNHLDQNAFRKTFTDIGVAIPTSQSDFLTPQQYSLFFRVLYNATYLTIPMSQKALSLLADYQDFPGGISAGLPASIAAAQKFGEHSFPDGTDELHDCGIVYHPQRPYFLCVMTKGDDFIKLTNTIRDISAVVYQKVDKNYAE